MMRRLLLLFLLAMASPAAAQIGTPSTGPLVPGGPRQGLGPPSLSDSVPDIRLHAPGGGIPGAGPPIDGGVRSWQPSPRVGPQTVEGYRTRAEGRHCRTPQRVCYLAAPARLGNNCSCRTANGRVRGRVSS